MPTAAWAGLWERQAGTTSRVKRAPALLWDIAPVRGVGGGAGGWEEEGLGKARSGWSDKGSDGC